MKAVKEAMDKAREWLCFSKEKLGHSQGKYELISGGISYGGGQVVSLLKTLIAYRFLSYQSAWQKEIAKELLQNQELNHVTSYVNSEC